MLKTIVLVGLLVLIVNPAFAEAKSGNHRPDKASVKQENLNLTIMGSALASQEQAVNFIKKNSPQAKINVSVEELVRIYYKEAEIEGIRADIAICQALLETGFFRYGGDVKAYQNNFCGLGSVGGGAKGASFATVEIGARAHIQHLLVYATKRPPKLKIVDPRYDMVTRRPDIFGVCKKWTDLNGRWAAQGVAYGERILDIHSRMLQTEPKQNVATKETSQDELKDRFLKYGKIGYEIAKELESKKAEKKK